MNSTTFSFFQDHVTVNISLSLNMRQGLGRPILIPRLKAIFENGIIVEVVLGAKQSLQIYFVHRSARYIQFAVLRSLLGALVFFSTLNSPPRLTGWDGDCADGGDGEKVEGGRADNGAGTHGLCLEPVADHAHNGQQDFRG